MGCTAQGHGHRRKSNSACCCAHCAHDRLPDDCPECCRCVPRKICIVFFPDDTDFGSTGAVVTHTGNGTYSIGPFSIEIRVELSYGECAWVVEVDSIGVHATFPIADVGCLFGVLEVNGVTLGGQVGTIRVTQVARTRVPAVADYDGCREFVCTNCTCFPSCACLRYNIEFFEDSEVYGDPPDNVGAIRQVATVCWDPDVGDHGGWQVTFDEKTCAPAATLLFEIVDGDGFGTCRIRLTTGGIGAELSSQPMVCDSISDSWSYSSTQAGFGYQNNDVLISFAINSAPCLDCLQNCCEDLPDTLIATVSSDRDGCTDAGDTEVTLYRVDCHSGRYLGGADVPWACVNEGASGTGHVEIDFTCAACAFNPKTQKCECGVCDGDEDPFIDGCHTINGIVFSDFAPCGNGSASNESSDCGVTPRGTIPSTCDPLFAEFNFNAAGCGPCCDHWIVTVTE